jgi:translocation and assembly module TamB
MLARAKLDANAELNFVGTVHGTPWVPEAAFDVSVANMSIAGRALDDAHLDVYLSHRDAEWVQRATSLDASATRGEPCVRARQELARASWSGGRATADGKPVPPRAVLVCGRGFRDHLNLDAALGLAVGMPLRGRFAFSQLPMGWLLPSSSERAPVRGAVTGQVDLVGGELSRPDSLVGSVELASASFGQNDAWLESDGPVRLSLTGQGARIEHARLVGQGSAIELSGGASMANGLMTNVAGTFDLALLEKMVPSVVRSRGHMAVDVKVTGKVDAPNVYGRARLEDGSLMLSGFSQALDHVNAKLSFSEREVLVEELGAQVAGGEVHVHGSAALKGNDLERYELFIAAKDINVEPAEGVELAFAADTRLTGGANMRIPELTGTVRLLRARYKRPFSLGLTDKLSGLSQAHRVNRDTYDPAKDRLAFDLRVIEESPIRITNNLLNAELTIEDSERPFRLVGTDQRIGVLGTLDITRGTLSFRNSQFILEDGTVTFVDEHRVRPRLDLRARTEFRRTADASGNRWWISLHASGDVDNLKLETSSEPALAQEDIALLLTVGLTRAEAERIGTTAVTQGAALEALATVTGVDREVKKALPVIDDFAVTSAYSARSNRTEPYVVVGKRISDRIRATATTGLTADTNFKTGVQWRFDDETSVEAGYDNVQTTTSSQFGNVGVDLRWRLEFD